MVSTYKLNRIAHTNFTPEILWNENIVCVGVFLPVCAYEMFGRNRNINLALATMLKGRCVALNDKAGCWVGYDRTTMPIVE